jgi:hypothetical protein
VKKAAWPISEENLLTTSKGLDHLEESKQQKTSNFEWQLPNNR